MSIAYGPLQPHNGLVQSSDQQNSKAYCLIYFEHNVIIIKFATLYSEFFVVYVIFYNIITNALYLSLFSLFCIHPLYPEGGLLFLHAPNVCIRNISLFVCSRNQENSLILLQIIIVLAVSLCVCASGAVYIYPVCPLQEKVASFVFILNCLGDFVH